MTKLRSTTGNNEPGSFHKQIQLPFEPGLTEKYPRLIDAVRAQIYGSTKPIKTIAADMDMSKSELSRKLNDNPKDPRRFTIEDLEALPAATQSNLVIYWLLEKYIEDPEVRRDRAITEIQKQLPDFMALLKSAVGEKK